MRHIDAFCHFFPKQMFELMSQTKGGTTDVGKRMQGVRTIYDLDARFRMMDAFDDYTQILSLGLPPLDGMAGPGQSPEFARVANDGLAELCEKYPDRFSGFVGSLPMDMPDAAANEAERILIKGKANGLQLHTNVNGACLDEPRFLPIFEIAEKSNKPILLHPARKADFPDFAAEKTSRYEIWTIFGWPYETSATMARLVFSGVMTRFPKLKIMTHHMGAMIPFFDERIDTGWATLGSRTSGEDYSHVLPSLGKPLLDCFRGLLRRHRAVRRPDRDGLRHRVLRRGSRALRVRRAFRSGRRGGIYPLDDAGCRVARSSGRGQGKDQLSERNIVFWRELSTISLRQPIKLGRIIDQDLLARALIGRPFE